MSGPGEQTPQRDTEQDIPADGLDTLLEYIGEQVRDQLSEFLTIILPICTDAFRLSGEAELVTDPERDELWDARARRTYGDLCQVKSMIGALRTLLLRDDPVVDAILAGRRSAR